MRANLKFSLSSISRDPSIKRSDSALTASSTSGASSAGQSAHGSPPPPRQDPHANFRRLLHRIKNAGRSSESSTPSQRKSISVDSIKAPAMRADARFQQTEALKDNELRTDIEAFWHESKARINIAKSVDWTRHQTSDRVLPEDIQRLKDRLDEIDARANSGIAQLRLTAYENLRQARQIQTWGPKEDARSKARRMATTPLLFGRRRSDMKERQLSMPALKTTEYEGIAHEAVARFKKRVNSEFLPAHAKDVHHACLHMLKERFGESLPAGPLLQLVVEISPDAVRSLLEERVPLDFVSPFASSVFAAMDKDMQEFLVPKSGNE